MMADIKSNSKAELQNGAIKGVPFGNILNFRDVGKAVNDFLVEKYVTISILHRSVATLKLLRESTRP